jgi:hypothetical protein
MSKDVRRKRRRKRKGNAMQRQCLVEFQALLKTCYVKQNMRRDDKNYK